MARLDAAMRDLNLDPRAPRFMRTLRSDGAWNGELDATGYHKH